MMNLFKRVCSIVLVVALIVTVFAVAIYTGTSAEGGSGTGKTEPKYGLSIGNKSLTEEEYGTVNISLSGSGVYGVYFELAFDNTAVTLSEMNLNDALDSSKYHISSKDNDGVFKVAIYSKEEIPAGNIASVKVTARKITDEQLYSSLELQNVVLSDSAFSRIDSNEIKLTNGEVRVFRENKTLFKPSNASMTFASDVALNFYAPSSYVDDYDSIYATLKFENSSIYTDVYRVNYEIKGENCSFKFEHIRPDHYSKNIIIRLNGTLDGKVYSSLPLNYSVEKYCESYFDYYKNDDSQETLKWKKLFADVLNYGACAQIYTESIDTIDTGVLCNEVNDNIKGYVDKYESKTENKDLDIQSLPFYPYSDEEKGQFTKKVSGFTPSILLESSLGCRLYFNINDIDISQVTVKVTTEDNTLLANISGSKIQYSDSQKKYYVDYLKYAPHAMKTPMLFRMYDKDGNAISYTFRFTIETYASAVVNGSYDKEIKDLCYAMVKYGISAKECS